MSAVFAARQNTEKAEEINEQENKHRNKMAEFNDFQKLDIRVGKIIEVEDFKEAKKPSYRIKIDFGKELGIKKSSAQLVNNYKKNELKDKLVLGIVNLQPKQIGSFSSEVLTLGVPDENHECILIKPDKSVPLGAKFYKNGTSKT